MRLTLIQNGVYWKGETNTPLDYINGPVSLRDLRYIPINESHRIAIWKWADEYLDPEVPRNLSDVVAYLPGNFVKHNGDSNCPPDWDHEWIIYSDNSCDHNPNEDDVDWKAVSFYTKSNDIIVDPVLSNDVSTFKHDCLYTKKKGYPVYILTKDSPVLSEKLKKKGYTLIDSNLIPYYKDGTTDYLFESDLDQTVTPKKLSNEEILKLLVHLRGTSLYYTIRHWFVQTFYRSY